MATNLMYTMNRTLLPKQEQRQEENLEEEDPRWELSRQLIEYKKFKDAAGFLSNKAIEQEDYFANSPDISDFKVQADTPLPDTNIFDLIKAFQGILQRLEESNDLGDIVDDKFTISDKIEKLLNDISPDERLKFSEFFTNATTKAEVMVTFLAVLELMKMNQFKIIQDTIFGEIEMERNSHSRGSLLM